MSDNTLSHTVETREDALRVLQLVRDGAPEIDLQPYIRNLMTDADDQSFAIMRGSGNEMSVSLSLVSLLEGTGLVTMDEAMDANHDRRSVLAKAAA